MKKEELIDTILGLKTVEDPPPTAAQLKKLKSELKKLSKPILVGRHLELVKNTTPNATIVPPNLIWSGSMVETLLRLRLKDFGDRFAGSKSNQQRAVIWNRLTEKFKLTEAQNSLTNINITSEKLQKKYQLLKVQKQVILIVFRNHILKLVNQNAHESEVDNDLSQNELDDVEKEMNCEERDNFDSDDEITGFFMYYLHVIVDQSAISNREKIVELEIKRQRNRRSSSSTKTKKLSNSESLVEMGSVLANGIIEAAKIQCKNPFFNFF